MSQEKMEMMARMLNIGMSVLRHRVILMTAMVLTFSLFVWCVVNPDLTRVLSATIFGFISYMMSKNEQQTTQGEEP
jgi:hypothetical protein